MTDRCETVAFTDDLSARLRMGREADEPPETFRPNGQSRLFMQYLKRMNMPAKAVVCNETGMCDSRDAINVNKLIP